MSLTQLRNPNSVISDLTGDTEYEKVFADFFAEGLRDLRDKYTYLMFKDYVSSRNFKKWKY